MRRIKGFVLLLLVGISSLSPAQLSMDWAVSWGASPYAETVKSIATDAAGNIFVTGDFRNTVDFDPGSAVVNMTSIGNQDMYVSKFDAAGNFLWARQIGGTGAVINPVSLKLDASGNIYLAGYYLGYADFDPGPGVYQLTNFGNYDIFVCKLGPSGSFVWAQHYGDQPDEHAQDLVVDAAGNVYLAGFFSYFVNFGGGNFVANNGSHDLFVVKLDPAGNYQWAKQIGGPDMEGVTDIALDNQGNLILTGFFRLTVDFDPGAGSFPMTCLGSEDIFILKLDGGGGFVWASSIGSAVTEVAGQVIVDAANNIYCSGAFVGTVDLAPGAAVFNATSSGNADVFITKLNPLGGFLWCKTFGGIGGESPHAMVNDGAGNIFQTGTFTFTPDFDPGAGIFNIPATGNWDGYVMKLDSAGSFYWAGSISGPAQDSPSSIALGPSQTVYVGGHFIGTADFDPTPGTFNMTSNGGYDPFLIKYSQCANLNTSATISATACGSYLAPDGQTHNNSGIHTAIIPNYVGCDSLITIQLTILPVSASTISPAVCDSFLAPDGTVYTQSGNYTALLTNQFGCDSLISIQLTILTSSAATISPTVCDSFVAADGNVYTQSGSYTAHLQNTQGCDSAITIVLTVQPIIATTQLNGATITANPSGAIYQWLDCDNLYAPIPGATAQSYVAPLTGSYAVVVSQGACTDTSACEPVIVLGIEEPMDSGNWISPNPSTGQFVVQSAKPASLAVFAANGACVYKLENVASHENLDLRHLPEGVYYVRLSNQRSNIGTKILIQR